MIIQCEQCRTKFRLDDSKIKDNGIKVRCAKCRHVFTVFNEQPEAPQPSSFDVILDQTPAFSETTSPDNVLSQQQESTAFAPQQQGDENPLSVAQVKPASVAEMDFSAFEPSKEEPFEAESPKFEFTSEPLDAQQIAVPPGETAHVTSGEIDFGSVNFDSLPADAFKEDLASSPFLGSDSISSQQPPKVEFDQQFSDLVGTADNQDLSTTDTATTPTAFDKPFSTDEINFSEDFTAATPQQEKQGEFKGDQEFDFSFPEEPQTSAPQPAATEPVSVEPLPVPPVIPQPEVKPAQTQPVFSEPAVSPVPPSVVEDELPPLCIPSRRKESSLFKILIVLIVIAIIGALGYFGKDLYQRFLPQSAQATGKITLRSVKSALIKNTTTGNDLLVISGEAVNSSSSPRAALQVKGIVYGNKGQVLASKNAYCGNPLSEQQVATMPLAAINAAMANQLGSALMNLEVAPGKAIPFTVVIATIPAGAKDVGVESAGSQAVAEKQK